MFTLMSSRYGPENFNDNNNTKTGSQKVDASRKVTCCTETGPQIPFTHPGAQ
jgi:hypothetical protein